MFAFLLINHPQLAHTGFLALETATWLNAICLGSLLLYPGPLASLMAPGRWGTVLNAPGSLWRLGAATLVYGAYRIVAASQFPLRGFALCAASILLIYADGSRTAMLLLLTAVPFLLLFAFVGAAAPCPRRAHPLSSPPLLVACALGILDLRRRALSSDRNPRDAVLRLLPIWDQLSRGTGRRARGARHQPVGDARTRAWRNCGKTRSGATASAGLACSTPAATSSCI